MKIAKTAQRGDIHAVGEGSSPHGEERFARVNVQETRRFGQLYDVCSYVPCELLWVQAGVSLSEANCATWSKTWAKMATS